MKEITANSNPKFFTELVRFHEKFKIADEDIQTKRECCNERIKRIYKYKTEQVAAFK